MWLHYSFQYGWFGASPDASVTDPHSEFPNGIAKFKCPYSKKELTPREYEVPSVSKVI